jgi:hypothetical protein
MYFNETNDNSNLLNLWICEREYFETRIESRQSIIADKVQKESRSQIDKEMVPAPECIFRCTVIRFVLLILILKDQYVTGIWSVLRILRGGAILCAEKYFAIKLLCVTGYG